MNTAGVSDYRREGPEKLIDAATAARHLGVSRKTLYAYVSRKLIHSINHPNSSRVRLYDIAELDDFLYRRAETRQIRVNGAVSRDHAVPILWWQGEDWLGFGLILKRVEHAGMLGALAGEQEGKRLRH